MILNYVFITPLSNLLNFTLKENTQLGARVQLRHSVCLACVKAWV